MSFVETEDEGWLGRILSSLKGMVFGLLFFLGSFFLLFWNEGNSVKTARSLDEGEGATVHVSADMVDPANEGVLVHVNALASTEEVLVDETFGVEKQALSLTRSVEMYQWKENKETRKKKKVGGGTRKETTYSYQETWASNVINSDNFKKPEGRNNPKSMPVKGQSRSAKHVSLGAFTLPNSLASQIGGSESLKIGEENIPEEFKDRMQVHGNGLYLGEDPANPQIGDVRVSFNFKKPAEISVCSQQTGETFQPFTSSNGKELNMLEMGTMSIEEMFKAARDRNTMFTWLLRGGGAIMMFAGLMFLMAPLAVIGDLLPFVGSLISGGSAIIAGILTIVFASGTIGFAWVFYRPLIGIPLLAIAGGAIVWLFLRRKESPQPVMQHGGFQQDAGPAMLGDDDVLR